MTDTAQKDVDLAATPAMPPPVVKPLAGVETFDWGQYNMVNALDRGHWVRATDVAALSRAKP